MSIKNLGLVSAAVTGVLLALATSTTACKKSPEKTEMGDCHGVNECRGKGACHGVKKDGSTYSCAGNNECKGQGIMKMSKTDCEKKSGDFKKGA